MKSSRLMAIILVAQAVLVMGVFAAVSSIAENSTAAVGEKKVTMEMEEPNNKLLNPGNLTCCDACNPISPQSHLFKCQDVFKIPQLCAKSKCRNCAKGKRNTLTCNDEFNGRTCGPRCPKN
ncbi:Bowman-Birk type wound-induced proteinase inhibitor WIP1-like isoform X2 [Panicum miliaceum]|uniref:Bowman-Birk type wound-induced proteinase inhibitor WIP1-like isoform X2 n=1 Tax=Panicum miliaceum TaxID=4540 RepID=A0A3L6Q3R5_PANMI|nr:Bowman-Birk type wound-induced proteinase inhibitor WIP1-like isoform X2 [Panicum miliaceum]